jgi:hypothetical protein
VEFTTEKQGTVQAWAYGEFIQLVAPRLVPDGLESRPVANEAAFVASLAQERDWDLSVDPFESYWGIEGRLDDPKLGGFGVGRLQNPDLPLGAQEQELWAVYRVPEACWVFGPLMTQLPATNDYRHEVVSGSPKLVDSRGSGGTLIWLELQSRVSEYLDGGARVKSTEWTYGYAFRVSTKGMLVCVAFRIPLTTKIAVDDVTERETALSVAFPEPLILELQQSTAMLETEQLQWVGRQAIGGF